MSWQNTTKQETFLFEGGLYMLSSDLKTNAGYLADCRNFEIDPSGGYTPMKGYEPIDGQTKPSEATFQVITFQTGTAAIPVDTTITDGGTVSGITLIAGVLESGTYAGGDAMGYLVILPTAGTFAAGDDIVNGGVVAKVKDVFTLGEALTGTDEITWRRLAIAKQMSRIEQVPGSGPIRGIVKYKGDWYAFRDTANGLNGAAYKSTSSGWDAVLLGAYVPFSAGHGPPLVGETLTGATSGATGVIGGVIINSGEWGHEQLVTNGGFDTDTVWTKGLGWTISGGKATHSSGTADLEQDIDITTGQVAHVVFTISGRTAGDVTVKIAGTAGTLRSTNGTFSQDIVAGSGGAPKLEFTPSNAFNGSIDDVDVQIHGDAVGRIVLVNVTNGPFQAGEEISTPTADLTASGPSVTTSIAPGGKYRFVKHNFYGHTDKYALYGVDGKNPAFEFDGTAFTQLFTGMATDTPSHIAVNRNHLFLGFTGGSVQHSAPGDPANWSLLSGAAEIGIGDEIRGMEVVADSLVLWTDRTIQVLYGSSALDWQLGGLSPLFTSLGATPETVQMVGSKPLFMYQKTIRRIDTSQAFGDFEESSISMSINKLLETFTGSVTASCTIPEKSQYIVFYDDGLGLITTARGNKYEYMLLEFPHVVRCCSPHDDETCFGSDTGFVYMLNSGSTHAGADIQYFLRTLFTPFKSPGRRKVLRKMALDLGDFSGHDLNLKVLVETGKYRKYSQQPSAVTVLSQAGDGFWNSSLWYSFYWSETDPSSFPEARLEGIANEFAFTFYSSSEIDRRYVLSGATVNYSFRGLQR